MDRHFQYSTQSGVLTGTASGRRVPITNTRAASAGTPPRRWSTIAAICAAVLLAPGIALAQVDIIVIANDPGGDLFAYVRSWEGIAAGGQRVEIDGFCVSACTLVLGLVPRERVCVTPGAYFGFHSVSINYRGHTAEGTRYLWSLYPSYVQELLLTRGWDGGAGERSNGMLLFDGTIFFSLCPPAGERTASALPIP